jgi:hypothetical protein
MSDARNVDQLRSRIDSRQSGDKMPWPDPAAAPLGIDDEAGGTPPIRLRDRPRGLGQAWWFVASCAAFAPLLARPFFLR